MTRRTSALLIALVAALSIAAVNPVAVFEQMRAEQRAHVHKPMYAPTAEIPLLTTTGQECIDDDGDGVGLAADEFACRGIDMLAFWPSVEFGGVRSVDPAGLAGNSDVWGWTDPATGTEIAMMGHTHGTAFWRVNGGVDAEYLGSVVNTTIGQAVWHDIKVINDHALIVSESGPFHGVKVVDLAPMVDAPAAPFPGFPLLADATFDGSSSQHNIVANDDTDYAYVVGGALKLSTPIGGIGISAECDGGLFMIDMADPINPVDAGCYEGDEYIHDAQCVVYDADPATIPEANHDLIGRELCLTFSEDYMSVVDVEDKANPHPIGRLMYGDTQYTHQGWFTEDFRYILFNDELDEQNAGAVTHTRTLVADATDIRNLSMHMEAMRDGSDGNPATPSIDHNNYVHEGLAFQSNYTSGLRVIDMAGLYATDGDGNPAPTWDEVAFFDTYPADDAAEFNGTWSNYPYFESGIIPVSGIGEGIFFLRLHDDVVSDLAASTGGAPSPVPGGGFAPLGRINTTGS